MYNNPRAKNISAGRESMARFNRIIALTMLGIFIFTLPALAAGTTYTVKEGDTLQSIAASFSISSDSIVFANKLGPVPLKAGQSLTIPDKEVARPDTQDVSRGDYTRQVPPATTEKTKGMKAVEMAKKHLGKPYVYGASGPNSFDCSGFTSYIYKQLGVKLNRSAKDQAKNGVEVSRKDLQPGDLLFFHTTRPGISHAGMYIGDGKFIHASSSKTGKVIISPLNSGYYNTRFVVAKRVW